MPNNLPLLVLTGLLGAELIFLRSLSIVFTSLMSDGCRVKFVLLHVEKRFLAQLSFAVRLTSQSEGVKGMRGLGSETEKGP